MEEMQKVKERAEKIARDAVAETKTLREPLEAAIIDNKELKRQMSNYDRDKAALAVNILFSDTTYSIYLNLILFLSIITVYKYRVHNFMLSLFIG